MPAHRPRSSSTTRILTLVLSISAFFPLQRQMHGEHRATACRVGRFHHATMRRDDLLDDPKAEAAAFVFGGEERLEYGGMFIPWNSRPGVPYGDGQHAVPLIP